MGALNAIIIPAKELALASFAVLICTSSWALQNTLKKIGKKPAMIVVAKAEFAQS
jgi:hypothetical protein